MSIFRKISIGKGPPLPRPKPLPRVKDGSDLSLDTPITTWEEGRKWLKEHGWQLWNHSENSYNNTVELRICKDNSIGLRVDIEKASSDLEAMQQAITKIEAYEEGRKNDSQN